jgi:cyanophycin synthetase
MQFGRIWTLRGPSIWARVPVLEAELDAVDEPVAQRLLDLTRDLQRRIGHVGAIAAVHPTRKPDFFRIVFDYDEDSLAKACLDAAFESLTTPNVDLAERAKKLLDLAHEVRLGPSTAGIVTAAQRRSIPVRRLTTGSLVQLGWGRHLRRIWTAETDGTPVIAETIAQDKDLTRQLLYDVGVPVPWGRPVVSADDAWAAAEELGLPVVVKPQYGNQGRGVSTNLTTREQVVAAYEVAAKLSGHIMVENYLPGHDHRLLVVGGKLVAASLREPAHVVGDGVSTIEALVAKTNLDPRRSDGHATPLSYLKIDDIARGVLAEQGVTPTSIPAAGQIVLIRRNANLSTGGTATDVTDRVHPDNALLAIDAARAVGLDIAGVDIVALDIGRPLKAQNGGVVEVNAGPGLRMHLEPSAGKPRDVGAAIVESLFPPGSPSGRGEQDGRIPVVAVTGVNGKTTTTRLIAHILRTAGQSVGMTTTDGIYLDGRRTETRDCSGPQSARAIFLNPRVDVAVLETARGGILREGLGFDRCQVAVVTNIGKGDHFGLRGIETLEELARVKRVVVENVADDGIAVLNAADPLVAAMADACPGRVVSFARDETCMPGHRPAVFVRGGDIIFVDDPEIHVIGLAEMPFVHGGVGFLIENALAAVGACWGVGVPFDDIRRGLATFRGDADECPARFNVLPAGESTVIVDYAHNPSALEAVIAGLESFPHHPRRTIVTAGSNRRDEDLVDMGTRMAGAFDRVVLYADYGHAGRADGELNAKLREGLAVGPRVRTIEELPSERAALDHALDTMAPGELVVLGVEAIEESLRHVRERLDAMTVRGR